MKQYIVCSIVAICLLGNGFAADGAAASGGGAKASEERIPHRPWPSPAGGREMLSTGNANITYWPDWVEKRVVFRDGNWVEDTGSCYSVGGSLSFEAWDAANGLRRLLEVGLVSLGELSQKGIAFMKHLGTYPGEEMYAEWDRFDMALRFALKPDNIGSRYDSTGIFFDAALIGVIDIQDVKYKQIRERSKYRELLENGFVEECASYRARNKERLLFIRRKFSYYGYDVIGSWDSTQQSLCFLNAYLKGDTARNKGRFSGKFPTPYSVIMHDPELRLTDLPVSSLWALLRHNAVEGQGEDDILRVLTLLPEERLFREQALPDRGGALSLEEVATTLGVLWRYKEDHPEVAEKYISKFSRRLRLALLDKDLSVRNLDDEARAAIAACEGVTPRWFELVEIGERIRSGAVNPRDLADVAIRGVMELGLFIQPDLRPFPIELHPHLIRLYNQQYFDEEPDTAAIELLRAWIDRGGSVDDIDGNVLHQLDRARNLFEFLPEAHLTQSLFLRMLSPRLKALLRELSDQYNRLCQSPAAQLAIVRQQLERIPASTRLFIHQLARLLPPDDAEVQEEEPLRAVDDRVLSLIPLSLRRGARRISHMHTDFTTGFGGLPDAVIGLFSPETRAALAELKRLVDADQVADEEVEDGAVGQEERKHRSYAATANNTVAVHVALQHITKVCESYAKRGFIPVDRAAFWSERSREGYRRQTHDLQERLASTIHTLRIEEGGVRPPEAITALADTLLTPLIPVLVYGRAKAVVDAFSQKPGDLRDIATDFAAEITEQLESHKDRVARLQEEAIEAYVGRLTIALTAEQQAGLSDQVAKQATQLVDYLLIRLRQIEPLVVPATAHEFSKANVRAALTRAVGRFARCLRSVVAAE